MINSRVADVIQLPFHIGTLYQPSCHGVHGIPTGMPSMARSRNEWHNTNLGSENMDVSASQLDLA